MPNNAFIYDTVCEMIWTKSYFQQWMNINIKIIIVFCLKYHDHGINSCSKAATVLTVYEYFIQGVLSFEEIQARIRLPDLTDTTL